MVKQKPGIYGLVIVLWLCAGFLLFRQIVPTMAQEDNTSESRVELFGFLADARGKAIDAAEIHVFLDDSDEAIVSSESHDDGSWVVNLPQIPQSSLRVEIERPHFVAYEYELSAAELQQLQDTHTYGFDEIILEGRITAGFFVATFAFLFTLALIALERLQNALAALTGISIVFLSTFILGAFHHDFYVLNLERAISYINWEVIFLVMGMMIVVGIIEGTGVFQWLAFQAYRASGGKVWLLIVILIVITSVASALLDNVTTMLLMVPISMQIALALNISPLALLIPEILASNISGISTLIGTPTNILIGAYARISFNEFLINQTVGVILASVVMTIAVLYAYRSQLQKTEGEGISEVLYNKLKENAQIEDMRALRRSLVIFGGMLVLFAAGESIHMVPAVTAIVGATILLLVVEPDIEKMLGIVDWTTLVFFMALFMLVGAIQEVGLLGLFAAAMGSLIGTNLTLGIIVIVFGVGLLSFVIANVPLAAAMLPVIEFISNGIPGVAQSKALYYALSMGAAMGGNGLLIGGETNLMTAGIARQAGYRITFKEFMIIGVPVTLLTLFVGTIWLLLRFVVFG